MFRKMSSFEVLSCMAIVGMLALGHISADDGDYVKPKRGFNGVSGLTPFPRTGRSDPDLFNWDNINGNHLNNEAYGSIEEYEDYPHMEVKRQGLIPFPRVGRSGASRYMSKAAMMQGMKRGVPGSGNAMWFGPRLGRIQKRGSPSAAANQDPIDDVVFEAGLDRETDEELIDDDLEQMDNPTDTSTNNPTYADPALFPDRNIDYDRQ